MELLILVLFFTLSEREGDLKRSLNRFLSFYRENRELITMLLGSTKLPPPQTCAPPKGEKEESRPREEVGAVNVLEEFLKRGNF